MNTVWILEGIVEYEINTVLGVFTTKEAAEAFRDSVCNTGHYDGYNFSEYKVQ